MLSRGYLSPAPTAFTAALFLAAAGASLPAAAQTSDATAWQTVTEFAGLDQSGLSATQKSILLTLIRSSACNCGCTMKIAECRVKDPKCGRSRGLAATAARELHEGQTADAVHADLARRIEAGTQQLLEEPVAIPIAGAPAKGPVNAKITLVEFSDFQCPYCAAAIGRIDSALAKHPQDIRLVFKQFPLDIHSQAELAAEAALAAHAQGKFWPMHYKLYANFREISPDNIFKWAGEVGMDVVQLTADLKSGKYKPVVEKEQTQGEQAGVMGTPTVFVNGKRFNGSLETGDFEKALQAELASPAKPLPQSR